MDNIQSMNGLGGRRMEDIILIGSGGHAKGVIDTIERQNKYRIVGFIEKEENKGKKYKNYEVIGSDDDLEKLFLNGGGVKNAFICMAYLGTSDIRTRLYHRLKEVGFHLPIVVDETAVVAESAQIGEGSYIGRNAVVNGDAQVGKMCIINNGAVLEHDCVLGDFSHLSVGAVACGVVKIGEETFVGANATILQCLTVGNKVKVGTGAIVLGDVPDY